CADWHIRPSAARTNSLSDGAVIFIFQSVVGTGISRFPVCLASSLGINPVSEPAPLCTHFARIPTDQVTCLPPISCLISSLILLMSSLIVSNLNAGSDDQRSGSRLECGRPANLHLVGSDRRHPNNKISLLAISNLVYSEPNIWGEILEAVA